MDKRKIIIAVLCMSVFSMSYMLIAPLLAEMSEAFPNATDTQVQLVYTIPPMVSLPFMILSGKMVYRFSKKSMLLTSMMIIVLSGILPVLNNKSLYLLYFTSILIGVGIGVVNTLSSSIISDYFKNLECARIMGYQSAAISIGGAIMSALSGKIAIINWSYSYIIFMLFIPCIYFVKKFLPKDAPVKKSIKNESTLNIRLSYFAFLSFLCGIFVTGYNANIALFIQDKKLGGVEIAGIVNSLFMLIGIPAGLLVGKLTNIFKRNIFGVSVLFIGVGFFITALASNLILIYIGAFCVGFGFAIRNPSAMTFAVKFVESDGAAMAIAIVGGLYNMGSFISPFVINTIGNIVKSDIGGIFTVCGACSMIISGLYFFTNPIMNNEEKIILKSNAYK